MLRKIDKHYAHTMCYKSRINQVWYRYSKPALTFHSTHYRWRRVYGSDDPTNTVIVLNDDNYSTIQGPVPPGLAH